MENEEVKDPIEPEVMKPETALAKPSIPVTVEELAVLDNDAGVAVIGRRHKIVDAMRRASVALTSPQDWLLFKAEDRRTAYLQDSGCGRIRPLWGIDITPTGKPETVSLTEDPNGDFAIITFCDAYCAATDTWARDVQGVRYSTEDFCKDLDDLKKKVRVTQASIANRNGEAVRQLTGLKNVAVEFLEDVWKGTGKSIDLCPLGKGYGSRRERQGAQGQDATPQDIPLPVCLICKKTMKYVAGVEGKYAAFYSCPDKKKGPDGKYNEHQSVSESDWRKRFAEMTAKDKGVPA